MTKEQLRKYQPIKKEHRQLEQRLRNLERRPDSDQETIRPLIECYTKKLEELVAAQLEIEEVIATLEPTERDLVRLRYIDGLDWWKVCDRIGYEWAQTHRLHAKILKKLEKL